MILSYLLGVGCGIAWWQLMRMLAQLEVSRKRSTSLVTSPLLTILFIEGASLFIAGASTFTKWPLSFPFWVGWPPGYLSIPEVTPVGVNLFETPLIIMVYSTQYGPPFWLVMPLILLYIYTIDAVAGFLGLATILLPYTYWLHQKRKRKALTFQSC